MSAPTYEQQKKIIDRQANIIAELRDLELRDKLILIKTIERISKKCERLVYERDIAVQLAWKYRRKLKKKFGLYWNDATKEWEPYVTHDK